MYRYYLAQIRSPKYYLSHIVLQRRSRTHTHSQPNILPLFKNTLSQTTQINAHKHTLDKHTHSRVSYYFYTCISTR